MTFRGEESVRTQIMINGEIIERVNHFNYFGNYIGHVRQ